MQETMGMLQDLAKATKLRSRIDALFGKRLARKDFATTPRDTCSNA